MLLGNISFDTSFPDATRHWNMLSQKEFSNMDISNRQRHWLKTSFERQFNRLVDTANNRTDIARFFGCRAQESGELLDVIPSRNLGYIFSDDDFELQLGYALGAQSLHNSRANVASCQPLTENMH